MRGKVVILNTGAGNGKDYAMQYMLNNMQDHGYTIRHREFKGRIFKIALAITGLSEEAFFDIYNDRTKKEEPQVEFLGLSPRQMMIYISETAIKPQFGKDYFGLAAAQDCKFTDNGNPVLNVFTDGGFPAEVFPLAEKFGAENILVVRFTRNGQGFCENDSRDFLRKKDCPEGVQFLDTQNDGNIGDFCDKVLLGVIGSDLDWFNN